jgi:hypothetical protein
MEVTLSIWQSDTAFDRVPFRIWWLLNGGIQVKRREKRRGEYQLELKL